MSLILLKYDEFLKQSGDLIEQHWEEVASARGDRKLKPFHEGFRALEARDMLFCVAMFDGPLMIGYSINVVYPNTHSSDWIMAQNDAVFLAPLYRGEGRGDALIEETEKEARRRGAHVMLWHAKPGTPMDKHFKKLKRYGPMDIIYAAKL